LHCSKCHYQMLQGTRFCPKCGESSEINLDKDDEVNFCPDCGSKRGININFCETCGFNFLGHQGTHNGIAAPHLRTYETGPTLNISQPAHAQHHYGTLAGAYASFGRRVVASLIDFVITFVFILIIAFILIDSYYAEAYVQLWGILISIVYKVGMESSSYQVTVCKMAMGIKVEDLQGQRITFLRALGRFFASYLSGLIIAIGYLMAAFTEKRQTLHDMIAGTVVTRK
jgi:uncharacterized RDD family membrane protein YckC/RNA polymerase subunit RPABC4/transcription elongation factor Spt4